jgi:hypothetical protein
MPTSIIDGNATAGEGGGARGRHTSAERNVHLGEHSTTKRTVLHIVVSTQGARDYSVGNIWVIGCEAAADRLEREHGDISMISLRQTRRCTRVGSAATHPS